MSNNGWVIAIAAGGLTWWALSPSKPTTAPAGIPLSANYTSEIVSSDDDQTSPVLEGSGAVLGSETYSAYDDRRDGLDGSAGEYEGDGCTVDCGGHQAGREWAEQRGVTDESECGGNSWSFREGCVTYAREQEATTATEYGAESEVED